MFEFFRGWKRKVGCATLVVCLLLTMSWIRSMEVLEGVYLRSAWFDCYFIHCLGVISWSRNPPPGPENYGWQSTRLGEATREHLLKERQWRWGYGMWEMPHWALILPLTLLAAWLLISKPRKPKPQTLPAESRDGEC